MINMVLELRLLEVWIQIPSKIIVSLNYPLWGAFLGAMVKDLHWQVQWCGLKSWGGHFVQKKRTKVRSILNLHLLEPWTVRTITGYWPFLLKVPSSHFDSSLLLSPTVSRLVYPCLCGAGCTCSIDHMCMLSLIYIINPAPMQGLFGSV